MTEPSRSRLRALFAAALELPEHQRESFLTAAAADEPELVARLRALLAHDRSNQEALAGAAQELSAPSPAEIGEYRVIRKLGAGGMGVVYLCQQPRLGREVAVKVLRESSTSASSFQHCAHEAAVLARFSHPHIAVVFDTGEALVGGERRPFLAMEYVDGLELTEFARRSELDLRGRIALFVKVCRAVQHAHGKAVLHRDLKPGNILVTSSGEPKVLDFGIARVVDEAHGARATATGHLVGTLQYMSPEQLDGSRDALDAQSDVYALGVIGYELLAQRLPYVAEPARLSAALEAIRNVRPARVRGLDPALDADLDAILQQALEKTPARRYSSAAALAEDLERSLKFEPILARPASRTYLLRCLVRRNRALVTTAAALFFAVALGVVSYAWQSREVAAADRRAVEQAQRAQAAFEFVERGFGAIHPAQARGRQTTAGDILDAAIRHIDTAFAGQDELAAHVRGMVGALYKDLGELQEASALLSRADEQYRRLRGPARLEHAQCLSSLGAVHMELGDYDTADAVLAEAADLERKLDPRDERLRLEIAMTKAAILQQRGDLEAAERALRDVLAERERVLGPDHEDALITTGSLGNVIASRGRPLEAEPLLTRAFEGLETLHGSDHPHTILARGGLIALAYDRGDYERAIALAAAGVDAARRVLGSDNTHFLEELNTYAVLLDESGRSAQAVELGREIVERGSRQLHADHEQLLRWRFNYALFLYGSEAFAEATSTAADVLERRRRVLGREHEQSIETGKLCVRCWLRLKDWGRVIEETSVLLGEAGAPDARLDFLYSRSLALAKSGRRDEAIAAARDTLELLEELGAGMPSDGRHYLQQLALLLDDAGAVEEAARARSSLRELPAAR